MEKAPGLAASEVTGVVFCGGLSRRMGQDKALLLSKGETLLQKAHQLLEPHVHRVLLSSGATARYEDMGLCCVLDAEPDMGPIGGLQAVLRASETPWVLILACDLPRLESAAVSNLLAAVEQGDRAVLYGTPNNPEPLFALYHVDLLPSVDAAVASGRRRMTSFLGGEGPGVHWLPLPQRSGDLFANVNHPEDWKNYQSSAGNESATSEESTS